MDTRVSMMALIRELDGRWLDTKASNSPQSGVHYGNPPPFFLDENCTERLPEIAREWGVPLKEFRLYAGLRGFINLAAEGDCEELPSVEELARRLGLGDSLAEFNEYLQEQLLLIKNSLTADEGDCEDTPEHRDWTLEEAFFG